MAELERHAPRTKDHPLGICEQTMALAGCWSICGDYKCAHSVIISAERWPDHVRLSDLEPKFTCKACGHRGADVRPLFERAKMGTEAG